MADGDLTTLDNASGWLSIATPTAAQQKLLQEHPSVNVSAGSLYLYDSKAAADLKSYADRAAKLRATKPPPDFLAVLTEVPGAALPATRVLHRGDPDQPREEVGPGARAPEEGITERGIDERLTR